MQQIHLACRYTLNHLLSEHELRRQISMLGSAGYECIYVSPGKGLTTPYFSEAWWSAADVIIGECRNQNIKFGICCEENFFTGIAAEDPAFSAQHLETEFFTAKANEQFYAVFQKNAPLLGCYAVYDDGKIENITSKCGTVSCGAGTSGTAVMFTAPYNCQVAAVRISRQAPCCTFDTMDACAVNRFIELTLEPYYRRYSKYFGNTVAAAQVTVPAASGDFPWTEKFPERYFEMWNCDIISELPHLFMDINENTPAVRERFALTRKELVCTSFLVPVGSWCRNHRISSALCLNSGSSQLPDELRCFRHADIPCASPENHDTASYAAALKTASSAAKLFGKTGTLSLAPCTANTYSLRELQSVLDFQMVMGITSFNICELAYSTDGLRKYDSSAQLFYQHTEWEIMPQLLKRTAELCKRLAASPPVCRTAMLYPVSSLCCQSSKENRSCREKLNLLAEKLLTHGCDFDFIDELSLVETGADKLAEKYECLVIPEIPLINRKAAEVLENFSGRLLYCGVNVPQYTCGGNWKHAKENHCAGIYDAVPKVEITGAGAENIFHRTCADGTVFLYNRSNLPFRGTFNATDIELAPERGELLENASISHPKVLTTQHINGAWKLKIDQNHTGLPTACVKFCGGKTLYRNVLDDNDCFNPEPAEKISECEFKFFSSGDISLLDLVLDESFSTSAYICRLNQCALTEFEPCSVYDCRNIKCDIRRFLRSGTAPELNTLSFIFPDGCSVLPEMPHLYGMFTVQFQHTPHPVPCIEGSSLEFDTQLDDLRSMGIGTYSGKAVYTADFYWHGGNLVVDCGRVEDAMSLKIDGNPAGTVCSYDYIIDCGELPSGEHTMEITVYNSPANRDFLHGLPAGLSGPVRLLRTES